MKNALIAIAVLIIFAASVYFVTNLTPKTDETKTMAEPESFGAISPPPGTDDFTVPELEDFETEINDLDQSINQL